jgi:type IV secretory pathway VirD2 relaxase
MQIDEKEFRLRPAKPKVRRQGDTPAWSIAFKHVMHVARMSRRGVSAGGSSTPRTVSRFSQRCAVRITYSKNSVRGQWRAHGRYIARESASQTPDAGFDAERDRVAVGDELGRWQTAGDPRLFKLILSPEFGERIDLQALTRRLIQQIEQDLGTRLGWVAVAHYNTEHPHVHVALRGIRDSGEPLVLGREYVKSGVRAKAEQLCTALLGYRTELDAAEALRRESGESRFTSLDRLIKRRSELTEAGTRLLRPDSVKNSDQQRYVRKRLVVLQAMGLAAPAGGDAWHVRPDFEPVLRTMQRANDRQKAVAAHSAMLSDPRLPLQVTDLRYVRELEGRLIAHGEEETTGRAYMLVEGTDAKVHFIYHTAETEAARASGKMRPNSFVQLGHRAGRLAVSDLGNADDLLTDDQHLARKTQKMIKRGILPRETGASGWLGRYQLKLLQAAARNEHTMPQKRTQSRSR